MKAAARQRPGGRSWIRRVAHRLHHLKNLTLDGPEIGLAAAREDRRDRLVFTLFDQFVNVNRPPVEPTRQRPRNRRLARPHESDQIDLVRLHAL